MQIKTLLTNEELTKTGVLTLLERLVRGDIKLYKGTEIVCVNDSALIEDLNDGTGSTVTSQDTLIAIFKLLDIGIAQDDFPDLSDQREEME